MGEEKSACYLYTAVCKLANIDQMTKEQANCGPIVVWKYGSIYRRLPQGCQSPSLKTSSSRWNSISHNLYPTIIHKNREARSIIGGMSINYTFADRAYWINEISEIFRPIEFFVFSAAKQIGLGYIVPIRCYFNFCEKNLAN